MTPELLGQAFIVGLGSVLAGLSGVTALGVNRLLGKTDKLAVTVGEHSERMAAMEVKLPNGEWRMVKDDVAALHSDVRGLRGELSQHILDETAAFANTAAVVSSCKMLLVASKKRKVKR
jgi:hypothetical protein